MQIVHLHFSFNLHPSRIRNFRAAIVEHLGLGHHLFHGHDNSEPGVTKYSNAYPLIRFAIHRGKATIVGMGEGADAILKHLLHALPSTLIIAGEAYDIFGWRVRSERWEPKVLTEYQSFGLYKWLALNKEHYQDWKAHEGKESARRLILDRCLTGHLRALAEAAGFDQKQRQRIVARVVRQDKVKRIDWHGTQMVGFNVVGESNFAAPYGLGLGRCHSFGFGEVCSERNYHGLVTQVGLKKQRNTLELKG